MGIGVSCSWGDGRWEREPQGGRGPGDLPVVHSLVWGVSLAVTRLTESAGVPI